MLEAIVVIVAGSHFIFPYFKLQSSIHYLFSLINMRFNTVGGGEANSVMFPVIAPKRKSVYSRTSLKKTSLAPKVAHVLIIRAKKAK